MGVLCFKDLPGNRTFRVVESAGLVEAVLFERGRLPSVQIAISLEQYKALPDDREFYLQSQLSIALTSVQQVLELSAKQEK